MSPTGLFLSFGSYARLYLNKDHPNLRNGEGMFEGLLGRKRKPQLTKDDLLASRAVINQSIDWSENDEGVIQIEIRRRDVWWVNLLAKVMFTPEKRSIALDDVGSLVWKLIDEGNTVRQMIGKLAKEYKLNRREAEASLTAYLRTLAKKRLIGFEVPDARLSRNK